MRGGHEHRSYNEREATAALKASALAIKSQANDRAARDRARILDIQVGLRTGQYLTVEDAKAILFERTAEIFQAVRAIRGRCAHTLAEFNATNPIDPRTWNDLVKQRAAIFDEAFDYVLTIARRPFPWQK
jgi:hypothetical protein